jgi:putative transposase
MASPRYRHLPGSVSTLRYHLVWCPKYRRPVLVGEVADALAALLREKAAALGVEVEALDVMPDHVHLFVEAPPTLAPQQLAAQFKGSTSRVLRQRFPALRSRLPSLWSRSYYVGSAGAVSAATVRRYVERQKPS